jgi:hypothetical protein
MKQYMSSLSLAEIFKYSPELFALTSTLWTGNEGEGGVEVTCGGRALWGGVPATRAGESNDDVSEGELLVTPAETVSRGVEAGGDVERMLGEVVGAASADVTLLDD